MIQVRCFGTLQEAAFLRDDINELNRQAARPDPFSTFEFYETYWRHDEDFPAGCGRQLWFLAAFEQERLIAYLALKRVTRGMVGLQVRKLCFLTTHDIDRPHLVARPDDVKAVTQAFYAYLLDRGSEWNFLEFQQQDESGALFSPPAGVDLGGYLVRDWPALDNSTIPVRWNSLQTYVQATSKKFRSNTYRQIDALFAEGDVELLNSSDPAVTPILFELCLGIEPHSWKAQAGANIARHPERIAYFRRLLDAQQPMRLSIQILLLDGMPMAGLICGAFRDGLYALHIVYDARLSRLSAGSTLLLLGLRQAIDSGCAFFNLMSGFSYYKSRMLAQVTELRTLQIYRAGSLPYWRRLLGDGKRKFQLFAPRLTLEPVRFNPSRRAVDDVNVAPTVPGTVARRSLDQAEQAHIQALVTQARRGQGEFLSAAELGAVLAFRAGPRPAPRQHNERHDTSLPEPLAGPIDPGLPRLRGAAEHAGAIATAAFSGSLRRSGPR